MNFQDFIRSSHLGLCSCPPLTAPALIGRKRGFKGCRTERRWRGELAKRSFPVARMFSDQNTVKISFRNRWLMLKNRNI